MRQWVVVKRIHAQLGHDHIRFVRLNQRRHNSRKAFAEQRIVRARRKRQIHCIALAFANANFFDKSRPRKQNARFRAMRW